ncbi:MAG: beta-lactamase family protein [Gemmatimonadetes bacterium]|nr:beta-lactamase family protein [Gemmatimonadota bacterium]
MDDSTARRAPWWRAPLGTTRALGLALGLATLVGGCGEEDSSRPGSPRTSRMPLDNSPFPYAETAEDVGVSSDAIWLFKERLYSRMVARHMVGAEILVLVGGQIVLHQAMGWADRDELVPMARNSIFRLASMTKPLAGTAVLMLVEEGRLGLDEPVGRYLDSFRFDAAGRITIRHLLIHRSGFVQGGEPPGYSDQATLIDAANLAGEQGPTYEPGERFIYSDLNSDALGAVVATITGEPVDRFIRRRILSPLGMSDTHTAFSPSVGWADRVPSSYRSWSGTSWERWWNPNRPHESRWFSPAGDLFGSAFDWARFLQAWVDLGEYGDGRLLEAAAVLEALADPVAADTLPARSRWYGMHWEVYSRPESPGGLPAFGHRGATGTLGMAIPGRDAVVVFLTNSNETEVVEEVIDAALEMFGS